ncbi:hypothetical protein EKO04_007477 [Ascochyta lentis]|uniref:Uncharacterized protein n=1 Tax=Ascochyta lentis TaxID=205686 RepID=A0A8H7J084_9PLEO|nr:hypothetical protein EKO04_007477 [Ascochyta lentis]
MVTKSSFRGRVINGIRVNRREFLNIIDVGSLMDQFSGIVHAWVEENGSISLGHAVKGYIEVHSDTTSPQVRFIKPYCWVKPAEDETGAARFEALVRYYTCIGDIESTGVRFGVGAFKEHFQSACRDVAEQVAREGREKGTAGRCVRLKLKLPRMSHQITARNPDSTPTPNPTAATAAPAAPMVLGIDATKRHSKPTTPTATANVHQQSFDLVFATFKDSLTTQINATQAAGNHEKAALTTQVHSLELKLADAKSDHDKLKSDLVAAKKEAEKWKAQYEGLKKAMQETMERGF